MTVYFIGAGPGAADLITVRAQRLLRRCPVCLYAGSIMPDRESADLLDLCPPGSRIVNTGPLTLEDIVDEIAAADAAGHDVARLHSGDPSIYSALAEQSRRLDALGITYEIVPGVPAFAAAAAVLGRELTVPGVAQTVTLTRVATLSTAMPNGEDLTAMPGTLVIHLAAHRIDAVVAELLDSGRRPDTPVAVVAREPDHKRPRERDRRRTPPPARTGTLNVRTNPYSVVYADGKKLGETPFVRALPAGTYTLTFVNPDHGKVTRRVTIKADQTTKVKFDL